MCIEIERKYLISLPDPGILLNVPGLRIREITQTYLEIDNRIHRNVRVRKVVENGSCSFVFTEKNRISKLSRNENEYEISEEEYEKLLPGAVSSLSKTRYSFPYEGHVFEIDVYTRARCMKRLKGLAVLEVELEKEDEDIVFPPFLDVITEISGDRNYSNIFLSKKIRK